MLRNFLKHENALARTMRRNRAVFQNELMVRERTRHEPRSGLPTELQAPHGPERGKGTRRNPGRDKPLGLDTPLMSHTGFPPRALIRNTIRREACHGHRGRGDRAAANRYGTMAGLGDPSAMIKRRTIKTSTNMPPTCNTQTDLSSVFDRCSEFRSTKQPRAQKTDAHQEQPVKRYEHGW